MDVVELAAVHRAHEQHVLERLARVELRRADDGPVARVLAARGHLSVDPLRQLHHDERQRVRPGVGLISDRRLRIPAQIPQRAPFLDEQAEQLTVRLALRLVFLALVPEESAQCVRRHAAHHRLVWRAHTALGERRDRRRPRAWADFRVNLRLGDARMGLFHRRHAVVPPVEHRLPLVRLGAHLFLGLAGDRRFVPLDVRAAGVGADQCGTAHPAGDRRAADVAVDDADGHIRAQFGTQPRPEMVGDGGHAGDLRRDRRLPAGCCLGRFVDTPRLRCVVEAQQRVGGRGDRLVAMFARVQLELHVALAAGKPDLTDHHIRELQPVCFM